MSEQVFDHTDDGAVTMQKSLAPFGDAEIRQAQGEYQEDLLALLEGVDEFLTSGAAMGLFRILRELERREQ